MKAIKRKIYEKIKNNEKVAEKKLPVTGKIITNLHYSYFFRKVTNLLCNTTANQYGKLRVAYFTNRCCTDNCKQISTSYSETNFCH